MRRILPYHAEAILMRAALAALLSWAPMCAVAQVPVAPIAASGGVRDVSMADYRTHLQALSAVVAACAKARDATACDPELVGADDRVPLNASAKSERRLISYDWLRALLEKAQAKDAVAKPAASVKNAPARASVLPPPPSTTELLKDAQTRLDHDLAQAGGAAPAEPSDKAQRAAMEQVLAERE
ncbi:MAG: hypothetical protein ACRD27_06650, partial [Terracidiphilus sp.]